MKNEINGIIKYPFVFEDCLDNHDFQTCICDFGDYDKKRKHNISEFQCRYKECPNKYHPQSTMKRIDLPINTEVKKWISDNNQSWIFYNKVKKEFDLKKLEGKDVQTYNNLTGLYRGPAPKGKGKLEEIQDLREVYKTEYKKLTNVQAKEAPRIEDIKSKFANVSHFGNIFVFDKTSVTLQAVKK